MAALPMPATAFMTSPVYTIGMGETVETAYQRLRSLAISSLPVADDSGAPVGVLSRADLLRLGRNQHTSASLLRLPDATLVGDVMTRHVISIGPEEPLSAACRLMVQRWVHRVFVIDNGRLIGVVSTRNVMRAIHSQRTDARVSEYMSSPLFIIRATESLAAATERLDKTRVTGLVVFEDGWPVGMFDQAQALKSRDLGADTPVGEVMDPALVCMADTTRLHRAAAAALAMNARRVIVCKRGEAVGIITGIDFARAGM